MENQVRIRWVIESVSGYEVIDFIESPCVCHNLKKGQLVQLAGV